MTIMESCDHHDEGGCVPDNRSRRRMLSQFRAAADLGVAVEELTRGGVRIDLYDIASLEPLREPSITVGLPQFLVLWQALQAWRRMAPRGDDWEPPMVPPAGIRVPPDDVVDPVGTAGDDEVSGSGGPSSPDPSTPAS
jgi:hypothetical protein